MIRPVNQWINEPMNQEWFSESMKQRTDDQWNDESVNHWLSELVIQWSMSQWIHARVNYSSESMNR